MGLLRYILFGLITAFICTSVILFVIFGSVTVDNKKVYEGFAYKVANSIETLQSVKVCEYSNGSMNVKISSVENVNKEKKNGRN